MRKTEEICILIKALNRIRLLHCVQSSLNTVSVFEYAATDTVLNVDFSGYKTSV